MKRYSALTLFVVFFLTFAFSASSSAQKKKPAPKRPAAPATAPATDMRNEAMQVADQLKNVTKFLYIYGKIANGLEIAEEQAKSSQASPKAAAENKANRDKLVTNIQGLKTGLENLAKNFQGNPKFQVQYLKISYAVESVANAEQLAAAGRYDEAGRALVKATEGMTDALTSMRLQ